MLERKVNNALLQAIHVPPQLAPRSLIQTSFHRSEIWKELDPALPGRNALCTGILTCYPSTTPLGLALGPTNPTSTDVAWETSDFRCRGFSPRSHYLCQHSHFLPLHQTLRSDFSADRNALLPLYKIIRVFGYRFSPVVFSAQDRMDQ